MCGAETVVKRGCQVSSKDRTIIQSITWTCFRKGGHAGPHRMNANSEWGKGGKPHNMGNK